ncbi:MAG: InlB B-repeat-containing protein [Clostridia bacterium]|nr:InlB B-repeat-containing protein [Clostridia bacterium]
MKLFKKSVSLFLALLMIFGSVSLLATAADAELNWSVDTKFYRYDGAEWVETTKAAKGEHVKARVFLTTDFDLALASLLYFYSSEFLTPTFEGYDEGSYKGSIAVPVNGGKYTGNLANGKGYDNIFDDMIYDGYITEDDIADKSWIFMGPFKPAGSAMTFDGSEWFFEIDFIVNEEPTGNGQFFMALDFISDYDNWLAPTTITGIVDGEEYISTEVPTGTFGYTLNDTDADSSLSCDNTVVFKANEGSVAGTASYTGYIGDKLSTIAGFSLPTASADGKQFLGWSTDGSTVLTEDQIKELTIGYEPLTLTAVFQAANATYKQYVYEMGTNGAYPETVEPTNVPSTPGTLVNASAYSVPAGFTLDTAKSTAGDVEVTADGEAFVEIFLKRNENKATFGETEVPVLYGATYAAPAGPAKDGYAFAGWQNGDVLLQEGDTATMGLADVAYTATYTPAANTAKIIINYVDQTNGQAATKVVEIATVTENTVTITEAAAAGDKVTNVLFSDSRLALENYKLNPDAANETSKVVTADGAELNLYYIPKTYTAAFQGAEAVEGTYYALKNAPAGPEKAGETFLGWSLDGATVALTAGQEFRLEGDATYTALYKATDYTVTYVFDGVAPIDPPAQITTANMGDEIALDEQEAAGWTFLGWTVAGAVEDGGVYTVGTNNVTVTGKWVKNTYVVNYWLDDAMTEIYFSDVYSFGDDVEVPEDPTDDILPTPGTTFVMWQQDVIDVIDADTETYFVEDPDVAGRYVYDNIAAVTDIEYTVKVYFIGVPEYEGEEVGSLEGLLYGDTIEEADLPSTEIEGYRFTGWKIGASAPTFPYTVTKDITIRGYFEIQEFDVVFYANDGAWLNGDTERTIQVAYGSVVPEIELPVREGYHLDTEMPWGVELGEIYDEGQEYYAEWIANKYTVSFNVEGTVTESSQSYESNITVPDTVVTDNVKPGYEFKGWTADGGVTVIEDLSTVTVPLNGVTYTAVYAPSAGGVDYKVNRYFMDTEGNYGAADVVTLHEVAETPVSYNVEVEGFTLDTSAGKLSDTVAGDGSTVLSAYYIRNKYAVNYVALGETVDTAEVYYEAALTASDDYTAAPAGYNFLGWSRNADAESADADLGAMGTEAVTLYAVLNPIEYPVDYVIAYEGNEVAYTTQSVAYKSAITAPAAPTAELPEGYSFIGWAATKGATEALADLGTMDTTVAEGKTFYAVLESATDVQYTIEKYFMETDGATYTKDAAKTEVLTDGVAGAEKTVTAADYEGFTFDSDNAENVLTAMVKGDGTTIFKVYYDRNTVKVTINGEEDDMYYGEEIKEEDMPAHPTAPEGKEPDGWVDGNGDPVEFPVKIGTEDIVINPNYKASEFEITFMNGDEEVQKSNQTFGEILSVPADVNVPGYTFDGWFADGVKVEAGVTTVPSKATTYTAKLTPIEYTVTFIDKNGTVATGEYAFGTKISEIAPAYTAPAGYDFGGWSKDGSTAVDLATETVPVDGVTYYAILTAASGTPYTVETYVMNTNGSTYAKSSETKYDVTDTVINYVPEAKTGFTVEDRSVLTGTVTGDGLMVIKVYYSRNKVTVTIDGEAEEYFYGETIEMEAPEADAGYEFIGWVDAEGDTVTFPYTVPANDVTITPDFAPIPYEVKFVVAGQEYSKGTYDFGTAIVNPGDPAQEKIPGYTFKGWAKTEDGEKVDLATETVPVGGVTYYALLEANDVNYTVKKVFQNTDGLTWAEPVDDVRTAKAGSTVELKAEDEGEAGFTVYNIDPAKATIAGNGSTVIYIYYTRNTVSITINGDKDTYYYGEEIEEPEDPSKDGYTFGGWVDKDGNAVEFPVTAEKDMVITPVFTANTVSLSFEVEGVTVEGYPVDAKVDSAITAPADPKKEGYNFVGWYVKGTNTAFNGKMPTTDTVYEARFTAGANTKVTIEIYTMNTDGATYAKTVAYTFGVTGTTSWVEANNDLPGLTPNLEKSHLSDLVAADGSTVLTIYYDRDTYTVTWNVDGTETTDTVYYGAEIVAPAEPTKDGYVFAGWTPEVPATMPEGNLEFTATWAEDEYTVTYVVNGVKTTETYAYGATVTVKEAPKAEGMTFNGWFDGETEYVPGATFKMPANDMIIVADFAVAIFKVTYLNADGSVFATEMVRYGDEIPVPDDDPVKEHYEFVEWNIIYDAMPAHDITVEPVFNRMAVKLIAKDGSKTEIDRTNFVITGLKEYLKEGTLRSTYLDVEGDGFFTVTPSVSDYCGTGAKVELYDNLDPSTPIETYVIVIYGDIDGDSLITAVDSTYADDEGLMTTNWSEEKVYDAEQGVVIDNPNYDPYKIKAADLNGDGIIDATDAQIIGDVSIGMLRINQVTGRPS